MALRNIQLRNENLYSHNELYCIYEQPQAQGAFASFFPVLRLSPACYFCGLLRRAYLGMSSCKNQRKIPNVNLVKVR